MDRVELLKFRHDLGVFFQTLAYYVFATSAVLAITVGILADPIVRHYSDKKALSIQQFKVDELRNRRDQQNELLRRLDNAEIVKRAARLNLNYVSSPEEKPEEDLNAVLGSWPELAEALEQVKDKVPGQINYPGWYKYFQFLAENEGERLALVTFGGCLVIVSITCFGSKRYC